jgi:glycopeptide antibiotics resistance protein
MSNVRNKPEMNALDPWPGNYVLKIVVWMILLITLVPIRYSPGVKRILNPYPLVNMYKMVFVSRNLARAAWNIGVNLLMFVPFGYLTADRIQGNKDLVKRAVLTGALFSLFIETVQYAIPTGRSADIDDVIINTLGAYLGVMIWKMVAFLK